MKRGPDGRFLPGYTGNKGGRPPNQTAADRMFEAIFSEPMVVKQNGVETEVTVEEALLLRAVEQAMKRKSGARAIHAVFKAIVEREAARLARAPRKPPKRKLIYIRERDSDNAFEAMCILGIAVTRPGPRRGGPGETWPDGEPMPVDYSSILLTRQAVDEALSRHPELPDDPDFNIRIEQHTAPRELPN